MRFLLPAALAAALLTGFGMLPAASAYASDSWLCTLMINNHEIVTRFQVNGDTLETQMLNNGKGHYELLENNSDHLISYIAFLLDVRRHLNNGTTIVFPEATYVYFILEKSSGQLTELDAGAAAIASEAYGPTNNGRLSPPVVRTQHCKPD
jgi:hypothetical protein